MGCTSSAPIAPVVHRWSAGPFDKATSNLLKARHEDAPRLSAEDVPSSNSETLHSVASDPSPKEGFLRSLAVVDDDESSNGSSWGSNTSNASSSSSGSGSNSRGSSPTPESNPPPFEYHPFRSGEPNGLRHVHSHTGAIFRTRSKILRPLPFLLHEQVSSPN